MSAEFTSAVVSYTGKTRFRAALERARDGGAPCVGQWMEFPGYTLARTVAGLGSDVCLFSIRLNFILTYRDSGCWWIANMETLQIMRCILPLVLLLRLGRLQLWEYQQVRHGWWKEHSMLEPMGSWSPCVKPRYPHPPSLYFPLIISNKIAEVNRNKQKPSSMAWSIPRRSGRMVFEVRELCLPLPTSSKMAKIIWGTRTKTSQSLFRSSQEKPLRTVKKSRKRPELVWSVQALPRNIVRSLSNT